MISLDLFDCTHMSELDKSITKYVNSNVECIIKVLLDYLEDDNGFTPQDFLPYDNFRINNETWTEWVKDLYDIIRSDVIRECIKPKYEYLLYVILLWWDECWDELLPNELDSSLADKIQAEYEEDGGECNVLKEITNFHSYYNILFVDHDFLPDSLERLVTIYLRNPESFKRIFADVDLDEYRELMPKDLQARYDKKSFQQKNLMKKNDPEQKLFDDIILCCERLQSNSYYKDASEDNMNDYIRDLIPKDYESRDQSRQGTSPGGSQAGKPDIIIRKDNFPFSIVEGLKLTFLDKTYISEHIDKIYKNYDTLGYTCNFIVSYVKIEDFTAFWKKYLQYVEFYEYPFELVDFKVVPDKQYSEIKSALAVLKRNGIFTKLYHIVIHIT